MPSRYQFERLKAPVVPSQYMFLQHSKAELEDELSNSVELELKLESELKLVKRELESELKLESELRLVKRELEDELSNSVELELELDIIILYTIL
jgi:hypothetical protein